MGGSCFKRIVGGGFTINGAGYCDFAGRAVDGKSPVEYITEDNDKDFVRQVAMGLLSDLPDSVTRVRQVWQDSLARR